MIIQINADTLRALMERSGVFDDFTCAAADYVWDSLEFDDINYEPEDFTYEELVDYIRFNWHCYWPGKDEDRIDVSDFYYDFLEPEGLYTKQDLEGICNVENKEYDDARLYLYENFDAEVLPDGSIVMFE